MRLARTHRISNLGLAVALLVVLVGCGAAGPDEGGGDGGGVGAGGHSGSSSGSGAANACPTNASGASANRIAIDVSWDQSLGVEGGTGQLIVWTKSRLHFDGTEVTGEVSPCGSIVPPIQAKQALGGMKIQPVIPDALWDSGLVPTTTVHGTVSGNGPGATITMDPAGAMLGVELDNPLSDPWPESWAALDTVDADGSGQPGVTAYPATGDGFAPAPLDVFPNGPKAEALYLATRSVIELQGTRDSCTSASGSAIVHAFDNHVVGCKVAGGGECNPSQVDFVDNNRTKYNIVGASYQMVQVADDASCADVRAALP